MGFIFAVTFCHQVLAESTLEMEEAFFNAAERGDVKTLRELYEAGVDVEAIDKKRGWRAIHYAAANGRIEALRVLVNEWGANVEARSSWGWAAIHLATVNSQIEALGVLVNELGANVEARTIKVFVPAEDMADTLKIPADKLKANVGVIETEGGLASVHLAATWDPNGRFKISC